MYKGKTRGFWQRFGIFIVDFWQQEKALSVSMIVTLAALIILISTYILKLPSSVGLSSLMVSYVGLVTSLSIKFPQFRSGTFLAISWTLITITILGLLIATTAILQKLTDQGIQKEIVAVAVTALTSIISLTIANLYQRSRDSQQKVSEKITPTYEKLVDFLEELRDGISAEERFSIIKELSREISKWGSREAKQYWNKAEVGLQQSEHLNELIQSGTDNRIVKLISALRRQIGLPNESEDEIRKSLKPPASDGEPLEKPNKRNQKAIELLDSWCEVDEAGEQEQRETWEYLKKALDEDRLSDRKLFP